MDVGDPRLPRGEDGRGPRTTTVTGNRAWQPRCDPVGHEHAPRALSLQTPDAGEPMSLAWTVQTRPTRGPRPLRLRSEPPSSGRDPTGASACARSRACRGPKDRSRAATSHRRRTGRGETSGLPVLPLGPPAHPSGRGGVRGSGSGRRGPRCEVSAGGVTVAGSQRLVWAAGPTAGARAEASQVGGARGSASAQPSDNTWGACRPQLLLCRLTAVGMAIGGLGSPRQPRPCVGMRGPRRGAPGAGARARCCVLPQKTTHRREGLSGPRRVPRLSGAAPCRVR